MQQRVTVVDSTSSLNNGGCASDVLKAAVYFTNFLTKTHSFSEALRLSLSFAGENNFCPVLVGAFCGALCGKDAIPGDALSHHRDLLLRRIDQVATTLASTW